MTHPEFFYINTGYCYERLANPARRIARAKELRAILNAEPAEERDMIRSLIQRGRLEYRAKGEK
jgi:hypothetical protein